MSRNGSGTYSLPAGNPVVTGTTITTTWANTTLSDISSALTGSVAADGQTPMSGSLNMANNKVVSVLDPTSAQDAATKTYVDTADALSLLKASNLSDVANATTSRTNLSAAKSGANSDITSITGLTTALTTGQGGTGSASTTYCNLTTNVTGTLPVANGGTGAATLTANSVLLGNGTSAPLTIAPSTSGNVLTSNGTTWASTAPIFSKSFVSSNQSIPTASAQAFTVAHSMGVVPKILRLVAVCLTAQYGWTVGAEGQFVINGTSNGNIQEFPVFADATNVYYGSGSSLVILNFSSGDYVNILNNSNFAVKIYAYA